MHTICTACPPGKAGPVCLSNDDGYAFVAPCNDFKLAVASKPVAGAPTGTTVKPVPAKPAGPVPVTADAWAQAMKGVCSLCDSIRLDIM